MDTQRDTDSSIASQPILIKSSQRLGDLDSDPRAQFSEPFFFIQGADTQFGMIERYIKKLENPRWTEEMELSEQLVEAINKMTPRPEFLVVCGDLLDATPGNPLRPKQLVDFKRIFSKLDPEVPLVCVCGNHDIGDEPTMQAIEEYRRDFAQDYFFFVVKGVLFIVIDSQFYKHRELVEDYARQQDVWLEAVLAKCKQYRYTIVFQHIPWFLEDPNEDDQYFNVSKSLRMEWLHKFKEAGVSKIMCGHYHREAGGWFDGMELVVTSAVGAQLGDQKSGARLVRVSRQSIEHTYYAMEELPTTVEL